MTPSCIEMCFIYDDELFKWDNIDVMQIANTKTTELFILRRIRQLPLFGSWKTELNTCQNETKKNPHAW